MKSVLKYSLIALLAIGTTAYAGGKKTKSQKKEKQATTCTSTCHSLCPTGCTGGSCCH